jgi:hypothetical protein
MSTINSSEKLAECQKSGREVAIELSTIERRGWAENAKRCALAMALAPSWRPRPTWTPVTGGKRKFTALRTNGRVALESAARSAFHEGADGAGNKHD